MFPEGFSKLDLEREVIPSSQFLCIEKRRGMEPEEAGEGDILVFMRKARVSSGRGRGIFLDGVDDLCYVAME